MLGGLLLIAAPTAVPSWRLAPSQGSQQESQLFHLLPPVCSALPPFAPGSPPRTHPLQQFAFQEGFDHVVGRGEVPRLVDEVHGLEARWEGVLGCQTQSQTVLAT